MSQQTRWMDAPEETVAMAHRRRGTVLVVGQFAFLLLTLLPVGPARQMPGRWLFAGPLFLIGVAIGVTALLTMGRATRANPVPAPVGRLFTQGIYARVRHPMYLGVLMVAAASTLAGGRLLALLALVGLALVLLVKIRFEEKLLEAEFGWEYSVYATHVPALLPRMFRQ
ncbi:MAG: methyltransferase family protein [Candidatus Nanopelagicales bacterium]